MLSLGILGGVGNSVAACRTFRIFPRLCSRGRPRFPVEAAVVALRLKSETPLAVLKDGVLRHLKAMGLLAEIPPERRHS